MAYWEETNYKSLACYVCSTVVERRGTPRKLGLSCVPTTRYSFPLNHGLFETRYGLMQCANKNTDISFTKKKNPPTKFTLSANYYLTSKMPDYSHADYEYKHH